MSVENRLPEAIWHVQEGRRIVAEQKARIAQMRSLGRDTADAVTLLKLFEGTQEIFEHHLHTIEAELGGPDTI